MPSIHPPHSAFCHGAFCSLSNARFKHRLLLLAAGLSVYAAVWLRECGIKAFAQEQSAVPASRIAQRPNGTQPQTVIWVNSQTGNDSKATGSEQAPFRTITQALQAARPNTIVQLAPGTYSSDIGEVFPILLKAGVTVQGNPEGLGQGTVIRGGGTYASPTLGRQNVTLVGVNQTVLTGVTVTNPQSRGHGLWVETGSPTIRDNTFISSMNAGMVALGSSVGAVQNNLFVLNRTGGMVIAGHAQPEVRANIFQRTGAGITVSEDAAPQIVGNRISQNRDGLIVQGNAHPVIRDNTIEDQDRDGIVVIAQAQPNLGTADAPGNNSFLNNRQHDINALATSQTLPAFGNQLASQQVAGKVDLTGKAALVSVTTVASAASRLPATHVSRASTRLTTPSTTALTAARTSATSAQPNPAPTLISSLPPSGRSSNQATSPRNSASSGMTQATTQPVLTARSSEVDQSGVGSVSNRESQQPASNQPIEISVPPPQTVRPAVEISVPSAERPTARSYSSSSQSSSQTRASTSRASTSRASTSGASASSAANLRASQLSSEPQTQPSASSTTQSPTRLAVARTSTPSTPTAPARPASAVEIPVPPPERSASLPASGSAGGSLASVAVRSAVSLPRQTVLPPQAMAMASPAVPTISGAAINIPVPPPETKTNPPVADVAAGNGTISGDVRILPVPVGEIPVGNTGDIARIEVDQSIDAALVSRRESLQYRVVVQAEDEQTQSVVQSLVPGAFVTSIQGQSVVQIGAFSSHNNAQEAIQMLSQKGLRGIIQPME